MSNEYDENEENMDEMVDAEAASIDSVSKASDATKKSPKRKSDKEKQDAVAKLDKKNALPEQSYDFSDELSALVESEETLSEEFKAKTAILFETAIRSTLSEELERLENEYETKLDEEVQTIRAELEDKVDSYLNYVVENWMEENQLAVESGLRTEIAENFMEGLKNLFIESYIEVPESKVDLVDELAEQVEELEAQLNESTTDVMEMSKMVESFQRESVIREATRDLAETQVEKLRGLVESLEFNDPEQFSNKVNVVKESYFRKSASVHEEETNEDWGHETPVVASSIMESYLSTVKRINK